MDKSKLIELIKFSKRKGIYELLYLHYSGYIDNLAYETAATIISEELGIKVSHHTIRRIRKFKQSQNSTNGKAKKVESEITIFQGSSTIQEPDPIAKKLEYLKTFKPIDVFAEKEVLQESGFKPLD
ncbi:hypothetical protein [Dyadobacter psychrotolerans]|uniref:Uncharacterized protein n=1 Tax=Dyadobacter psychrotolerans TaxID=2541721 RepID=A0A4V6PFM8_9BACT|nr:hypothetical protein [Dyadobacter psychrotolerans]TDE09808.1 hypothetical protein E0F88_29910 [Dyadobacter psychrotolerans]